MSIDNRLISSLHRLYLNGRLNDISRGDDDLFDKPLSAQWLQLRDGFPSDTEDWEKAKQWQAILYGITRTAGIIFGSHQYHILFDAGYDEDYHSSVKQSVVVSTEPVKHHPPGFTFYDAVDTMTGQVMHEAAHLRERQTDKALFVDDEIMSLLYHLVEDVIIDTIIAKQYPGFEGYLLKYRRYLIDWKLRNKWSLQVEGRLKQLILSMRSTLPVHINRWSVRHAHLYLIYMLTKHRTLEELRQINRAELAVQLYSILYEARQADHWREPDVLSESFVLGVKGPPVEGGKGHNHGGLEVQPITSRTLQQQNHKDFEWVDEAAKAILEKTVRKKKGVQILRSKRWSNEYLHHNTAAGKHQALSPEEHSLLSKLVEERRSPLKGTDSNYDYQAQLSLLPLHAQAEERYHSAADAVRSQIVMLRNQLVRASVGTTRDLICLKSGDLDEEALYRARYAADLFKKPAVSSNSSGDMDFALLIDTSRSMKDPMPGGSLPKYIVAQRLAAMFVEALEPLRSINTWAFSFSSLERTVDIRELYSPDIHANKARIGDLYPMNKTPEYQALLAVDQRMREVSRSGVKNVFIVVSDGNPEDDAIPRDRQIGEIKKLVRRLSMEGNTVIHVALSPDELAQSIYPYRLSFPVEGYPDLIRRFGKLLLQWAAPAN